MRVAIFDSKPYDRKYLLHVIEKQGLEKEYDITFFEVRLTLDTVELANGYQAVCLFVNDRVCADVVADLADMGIGLITLRCAGYDRVALKECEEMGISVTRVPAYSPNAVAEFAVALLLTLSRKVHIAYNRVRDGNFSLNRLVGPTLYGKTVGVLGTGRIGQAFIKIMLGFGCHIVAYDVFPDETLKSQGVKYDSIEEVVKQADVISIHLPLLPSTHHLIDKDSLLKMKNNVIIINTSRGGIIDSRALIKALKSGQVAGAGLDVYEHEEGYFFEDHSGDVIVDDALARLQNMNNVLITSHQAFFTEEALYEISLTTVKNLEEFRNGGALTLTNVVKAPDSPLVDAVKRRQSFAKRRASGMSLQSFD